MYDGPKRNWKQCLCKILEGQTKSIMVFLILAYFVLHFCGICASHKNVVFCQVKPCWRGFLGTNNCLH